MGHIPPTTKKIEGIEVIPKWRYPEIMRTLTIWRNFVEILKENRVASVVRSSKEDFLLSDSRFTLTLLISILELRKDFPSPLHTFLTAIDSKGKVQAVLSLYHHRESLEILQFATAPWNLSLPLHKLNKEEIPPDLSLELETHHRTPIDEIISPLKGGGTLLIDAAYRLGQREGKKELTLRSTYSAIPFYEKLGMKKGQALQFFYPIDPGTIPAELIEALAKLRR